MDTFATHRRKLSKNQVLFEQKDQKPRREPPGPRRTGLIIAAIVIAAIFTLPLLLVFL